MVAWVHKYDYTRVLLKSAGQIRILISWCSPKHGQASTQLGYYGLTSQPH